MNQPKSKNKPRAQSNGISFEWSTEDGLLLDLMQGKFPMKSYLHTKETRTGEGLLSRAGKQGWSCAIRILLLLDGHDPEAPIQISSEDDLLLALVLSPNLEDLERSANAATGGCLLDLAAANAFSCTVKMLLLVESDFKAFDSGGENSLAKAISSRSTDIVDEFLKAGASIDSPATEDGKTMLHLAVCNKDLDMIEFLVRKGANFMTFDSKGGNSLAEAVFSQSTETVNKILEEGASIDSPAAHNGQTMLHTAVSSDDPNMIEFLLSKGANLFSRTRGQLTPVAFANESTRCNGLEAAIVNSFKNDKGPRDVIVCATHGARFGLMKELLEVGVDVKTKASRGATALHEATEILATEIVKFLLDMGADVNAQDCDGNTALHMISRSVWDDRSTARQNIAMMLLNAGADNKLQNKSGDTALHMACSNKKAPLDVHLKHFHGDINILNFEGQTPLHVAAYRGYREHVEKLLKRGADRAFKDNEGRTPPDIARAYRVPQEVWTSN